MVYYYVMCLLGYLTTFYSVNYKTDGCDRCDYCITAQTHSVSVLYRFLELITSHVAVDELLVLLGWVRLGHLDLSTASGSS